MNGPVGMSTLEQPAVRARRPARFVVFGLAVLLVVGTLSARLFALQISGRTNQPAVAPVATRMVSSEPIRSTRGLISDRSGTPLVRNVPTFTVRVRPADLPLTKRQSVVERLAGLLGMTPAEVNAAIDTGSTSRFDYVPIARDVPEATARLISEESLTLPWSDRCRHLRRAQGPGLPGGRPGWQDRGGSRLRGRASRHLRHPAGGARPDGADLADASPATDPVLSALGHSPASLDVLARRTGMAAATLAAELTRLELAGHVERLPGGLYRQLAVP